MKAYVELSYLMSDYSEVCCNADGAVGFIFCTTVRRRPSITQRKALHKLLRDFLSGITEESKTVQISFKLPDRSYKVDFLCRRFTSEVILFAVDNDVRGHGIGRKLMDRYIVMPRGKSKKRFASIPTSKATGGSMKITALCDTEALRIMSLPLRKA
jgi:ribosomal protein S18 acetylase RimI-like enzyme